MVLGLVAVEQKYNWGRGGAGVRGCEAADYSRAKVKVGGGGELEGLPPRFHRPWSSLTKPRCGLYLGTKFVNSFIVLSVSAMYICNLQKSHHKKMQNV